MASVVKVGKGRFAIHFTSGDRKRRTLRLPKCSERDAETICGRVEDLRSSIINGLPLHAETSRWVAGLSQVMADKLASVGLIAGRSILTLGDFLKRYIAERTDVKPSTRMHLEQARQRMVEFFGADIPLYKLTPGDADRWLIAMEAGGLGTNTARRTCGRAKQFFRAAIRRRLIEGGENPFDGLKTAVGSNKGRFHFVTVVEAEAVIDACPNSEWRALVSLSRWGGIRVPSEITNLTWDDVDWDRGRVRIESPKTEHHEGHGERLVPLFPELRKHLAEALELAEPGERFILPKLRGAKKNLRTQFMRIIRKAGLTPWEKPFANCRSTRETELCETFPLHVVVAWLGNSEAVARRHYLQITDEHFERAAGLAEPLGDVLADIGDGAADESAVKSDVLPTSQVFAQARRESQAADYPAGFAGQCGPVRRSATQIAPRLGLEPRT